VSEDLTPKEPAKLWTYAREIASALWGDDVRRDNGLRSDVRRLEFDMETVKSAVAEGIAHGNYLYEVERHKPGGCIGRIAVEQLEQRLTQAAVAKSKEITELRKARMGMFAAVLVAFITSVVNMIPELVKLGQGGIP
jgi:hypothetical protein